MAQGPLIIPDALVCRMEAVNVIHVQQQAHAVLYHDAGCQLRLLLQRSCSCLLPGNLLYLHNFCRIALPSFLSTQTPANQAMLCMFHWL